jgi:hypothetical protein
VLWCIHVAVCKLRLIAKENGLQDKITFIKSKVEQLDKLAHGITHVDFIISEWMGYCLLFEFMLPSVVVARDRWMVKEGGSGLSLFHIIS